MALQLEQSFELMTAEYAYQLLELAVHKHHIHAVCRLLVRHGGLLLPELPRGGPQREIPAVGVPSRTSVAASLLLVKAVPQKPCSQPVKDDFAHDRRGVATWCWRSCIPEAIELAACCAQRSSECLELPVRWPDEWLGYDHHGGSKGEPSFVSVSLTLLMAVLSYHAKDAREPSPACTTRRSCWSPQPPQWWHPWVGGCSLSRR